MFFIQLKKIVIRNIDLVTKYATAIELSWDYLGAESIEYYEIFVTLRLEKPFAQ